MISFIKFLEENDQDQTPPHDSTASHLHEQGELELIPHGGMTKTSELIGFLPQKSKECGEMIDSHLDKNPGSSVIINDTSHKDYENHFYKWQRKHGISSAPESSTSYRFFKVR